VSANFHQEAILNFAERHIFIPKILDYTSLLVPSNSDVGLSLADKFNNVKKWALENRKTINMQKTKENIFHSPVKEQPSTSGKY